VSRSSSIYASSLFSILRLLSPAPRRLSVFSDFQNHRMSSPILSVIRRRPYLSPPPTDSRSYSPFPCVASTFSASLSPVHATVPSTSECAESPAISCTPRSMSVSLFRSPYCFASSCFCSNSIGSRSPRFPYSSPVPFRHRSKVYCLQSLPPRLSCQVASRK
jgi:hypothetical protein